MLAGAVPFLLYVRLLRGTSGFVPWSQIPVMLAVVAGGGGLLALAALQAGHGIVDAIRHGLFTVTSIITTTGFMSRSEEHTSELQSLMRISYAVFCLKKKKKRRTRINQH